MIKIDNPTMSLFQAACLMPANKVKEKFKTLGFLVQIVKGEKIKHSCKRCYRFMCDAHELKKHEARCGQMSRIELATLKLNQTFYCQMGCNFQTKTQIQMAKHFYNCHTHEELRNWGINRDLLPNGQ